PLLASWRYGLGKAIAFTSDAKARWLSNWIGDEVYTQFWIQSVRWVLRNQEPSDLRPRVEVEGGRGRVIVDAVDENDRYINFLDLIARVGLPETADAGSTEEGLNVRLRQTSPGRYEGEF